MHTDRQAFRAIENTPEKRDGKFLIKKFFDFSALNFHFSNIKNEDRQNAATPPSI